MLHLDEGTLQALLDGELPPRERARAEAHLAACGECAAAAAELRGFGATLTAALARADVPAPVAAAQLAVRGRRAQAARAPRWAVARTALARAAVLVLALAGVAAAAVPGSPVREWIEEVVAGPKDEAQRAEPLAPAPAPAQPAAPAAERAAPSAGVSILPDDGAVRVVLTEAAKELRVRVRLVDGPLAEADAAGARFRAGAGRIEVVDAAGPGEVRVDLPRAARNAVVEVNGRTCVAKDGDRLRSLVPGADPSAAEAVFRVDECAP